MNIAELFPTNFLSSADIPASRTYDLTITGVELTTIGSDGERKRNRCRFLKHRKCWS